jgi:hypothetical protein
MLPDVFRRGEKLFSAFGVIGNDVTATLAEKLQFRQFL